MKTAIVTSAFVATAVFPALARAEVDAPTTSSARIAAPAKAFELTIANGYNQGFGHTRGDGVSVQDLSGGGYSLQLGFGYRINPHWMVGGYLEGSRFTTGSSLPDDTSTYSAATGVEGRYYFLPFSRVAPWIGLGTGVRGHWVDPSPGKTSSLYGVDILRLRVGTDFNVGTAAAIGPVIGASLTTMTDYDDATTSEPRRIDSQGVSTFIYAGVQARFDFGGKRVSAGGSHVASR